MLVTNEDVVLKVTSHGAALKPVGLKKWIPCARRITYSATQNSAENTTVVRA